MLDALLTDNYSENEKDYKKGEVVIGNEEEIKNLLSSGVAREISEAERQADYADNLTKMVYELLLLKQKGEATELIVNEILKDNSIYSTRDDENSEVWIYSEGIYIPQGRTFIKEFCRKVLGPAYTTNFASQVIAKIEADTYIDSKVFFATGKPDWIAVKNGLLNIFTLQLRDFTPKEIYFNKLPITYDPTKDCPFTKKHFSEVLKYEEDVLVIGEIFGFLLLKDYKYEKAFLFSGGGRNGKGKTISLMKEFLGIDNCSSVPLQQFDADVYAKGELFNKLANLAGDLDNRTLKYTGAFKELTGRDLIAASRKFLPRVNFVNYAKLVFACNTLPNTYDVSVAFWDRWIILDFPFTFVPKEDYDKLDEDEKKKHKIQDPDILQKLAKADELSGLLNLALIGLKRLNEKGDFSDSKTTDEVRELWLRRSSSFQAFILDRIESNYESKIDKKYLRKEYSAYCSMFKLKALSDKVIKETLAELFGSQGVRENIKGEETHYWEGIGWKQVELGRDVRDVHDSYSDQNNNKRIRVENMDIPTDPTDLTKKALYLCCICGNQAGLQGNDGKLYCSEHYMVEDIIKPKIEDTTFKIELNWRPIGVDG